jgi:hypothetical protein
MGIKKEPTSKLKQALWLPTIKPNKSQKTEGYVPCF